MVSVKIIVNHEWFLEKSCKTVCHKPAALLQNTGCLQYILYKKVKWLEYYNSLI